MSDVYELLRRQAVWQKERKSLSWPEKIRMVEAIRQSVLQLCRGGRPATPSRSRPAAVGGPNSSNASSKSTPSDVHEG